jgi:hypothetical protein
LVLSLFTRYLFVDERIYALSSTELERPMYHRIRLVCVTVGASMLLAQAGFAEHSQETTVAFDPAVTALFQKDYGTHEAGVLRSTIIAALAKEERHAAIPEGLTLKVTVRSVAPTHPTMKQQLDDPSLSPVRSRSLGGADLVGEIRNSSQQIVATVGYSNFAAVLPAGSVSLDPWADARLAIDAFAAKFAATWDKLPKS